MSHSKSIISKKESINNSTGENLDEKSNFNVNISKTGFQIHDFFRKKKDFQSINFEYFTKFGTLFQQENSSSTLTPTTIIVKTSVFPIILINQIEINAAPAPVVLCPRGFSLDQLNLRWVLDVMLVTWCPRGALFGQPIRIMVQSNSSKTHLSNAFFRLHFEILILLHFII